MTLLEKCLTISSRLRERTQSGFMGRLQARTWMWTCFVCVLCGCDDDHSKERRVSQERKVVFFFISQAISLSIVKDFGMKDSGIEWLSSSSSFQSLYSTCFSRYKQFIHTQRESSFSLMALLWLNYKLTSCLSSLVVLWLTSSQSESRLFSCPSQKRSKSLCLYTEDIMEWLIYMLIKNCRKNKKREREREREREWKGMKKTLCFLALSLNFFWDRLPAEFILTAEKSMIKRLLTSQDYPRQESRKRDNDAHGDTRQRERLTTGSEPGRTVKEIEWIQSVCLSLSLSLSLTP
jgi:hypothetical protein